MPDPNDVYQNPLCERYASEEMLRTFSANERYRTWRRLWIALGAALGATLFVWAAFDALLGTAWPRLTAWAWLQHAIPG